MIKFEAVACGMAGGGFVSIFYGPCLAQPSPPESLNVNHLFLDILKIH